MTQETSRNPLMKMRQQIYYTVTWFQKLPKLRSYHQYQSISQIRQSTFVRKSTSHITEQLVCRQTSFDGVSVLSSKTKKKHDSEENSKPQVEETDDDAMSDCDDEYDYTDDDADYYDYTCDEDSCIKENENRFMTVHCPTESP